MEWDDGIVWWDILVGSPDGMMEWWNGMTEWYDGMGWSMMECDMKDDMKGDMKSIMKNYMKDVIWRWYKWFEWRMWSEEYDIKDAIIGISICVTNDFFPLS